MITKIKATYTYTRHTRTICEQFTISARCSLANRGFLYFFNQRYFCSSLRVKLCQIVHLPLKIIHRNPYWKVLRENCYKFEFYFWTEPSNRDFFERKNRTQGNFQIASDFCCIVKFNVMRTKCLLYSIPQ